MSGPARVHPSAEVEEGARIGDGTAIWHLCHIRKGSVIGSGCNIGRNVYVDAGVTIGDRVKVQNNVSIYRGVTLEDEVFVGPDAVFTNDVFPRAAIWSDERLATTVVKRGASVGANATVVCGGRTIGEYALIAAGAVVTRDVPPHALVLGNPARIAGIACFCGKVIKRLAMGKEPSDRPARLKCGACGKSVDLSWGG